MLAWSWWNWQCCADVRRKHVRFLDSRLNWRNLKHHVLFHQIKELFPGMERKHLSSPEPGDLFLRANFLSTWHPFSHFLAARGVAAQSHLLEAWAVNATRQSHGLWKHQKCNVGDLGFSLGLVELGWSEHELLGMLGDLILHRGWSILSKYLIRGVNYIHHFTMSKFQRTEKVSFAEIPTRGITPVYVLEGLGSLAVLWYIWCYWKLCTFKNLWNPCFRRLFVNYCKEKIQFEQCFQESVPMDQGMLEIPITVCDSSRFRGLGCKHWSVHFKGILNQHYSVLNAPIFGTPKFCDQLHWQLGTWFGAYPRARLGECHHHKIYVQ